MALWSVMHSTSMPAADDGLLQLVGRGGASRRTTSCGCGGRPGPTRPAAARRGADAGRPRRGRAAARHRRPQRAAHGDVADDQATRRPRRIGSQSTSPPTSTTSCSIRCSVEAMVNSRTGSASCAVADHEARGTGREVAADTGFTPECRPCTIWMSTPSSTSATSSAWVAGARDERQREAAAAGRST